MVGNGFPIKDLPRDTMCSLVEIPFIDFDHEQTILNLVLNLVYGDYFLEL